MDDNTTLADDADIDLAELLVEMSRWEMQNLRAWEMQYLNQLFQATMRRPLEAIPKVMKLESTQVAMVWGLAPRLEMHQDRP